MRCQLVKRINKLGRAMHTHTTRHHRISFTAETVPPILHSHINGEYFPSLTQQHVKVMSPADGTDLTLMPQATQDDIDYAFFCANEAQQKWANTTGAQRADMLMKLALALDKHNDELAKLESLDTGRPIAETKIVDVVSARDCLNYMAGVAATMSGQHITMPGGSFAYTRREPLGVVGAIGAWNYPIQGMVWKLAPALAGGNAVIFKPSELTPLSALAAAELFLDAGLPKGLFNVVLGGGSTGAALAAHPGIAKVSFTGSVATGTKVYTAAARDLKKCTMELGGKSPLIIFEDAELENAVSAAIMANWYSSGQVCSNGTRVFVHKAIKQKFLERLVERTKKMRIGNPMAPTTDIGSMISEQHMLKVLKYIESATEEGAKLVYGGDRVTVSGCEGGFYLSPAIFECLDHMQIVKEEVFGMLMAVLEFENEEDVVTRANNTSFGLSAGVFTRDIKRAHRVIHQMQAGTTWINNYNVAPVETPWGGFKKSGVGRENGTEAINHYTQLKSVYVEMNDVWAPY